MLAEVSAIVQALQSASIIEDVRRIAHTAFAGYGFNGFMCITVPLTLTEERLFILESNWPREWMDYYVARGHQLDDPTITHISETDEPFLSLEIKGAPNDPEQAEIRAQKKAFGLEFELVIPVQVETNLRGGIFLIGSEKAAREANRHELQLIALTVFAVAHQFFKTVSTPLTKREREM